MSESIEDYAKHLADGIEAALPAWVVRSVERVMAASGQAVTPEVSEAARAAGREALAQTVPAVRRLLAEDIDAQRDTPLTLLRKAVSFPTSVLRAAGAAPPARDRFAREVFPDDDYDLSPATWSDIDPALAELGIAWGAAKAFEHKRRHQTDSG